MPNLQHSFDVAPTNVNHRRSIFSLNHTNKLDFNAGDLIPIDTIEILPGDTISMDLSAVVRLSTPLVPVMDDAFVDVFVFFVPNRIIWKHWEEFCGENKSSYWAQTTDWILPYYESVDGDDDFVAVGSAGDFLGYGAAATSLTTHNQLHCFGNVLPAGAYVQIWNDWFRDQNTQAPQKTYFDDNNGFVYSSSDEVHADISDPNSFTNTLGLLPVNKIHDYFTSCLPAPQKGNAVSLPLGQLAPVVFNQDSTKFNKNAGSPVFAVSDGTLISNTNFDLRSYSPNAAQAMRLAGHYESAGTVTPEYQNMQIVNAYADLSSASAATINQLRQAFATQYFLENDARFGTRYVELLLGHFGVNAGDYRLNRPEYLGGSRIPVQTTQVSNNTASSGTPLGTLAGFTYGNHNDSLFTKSFVEHGQLLVLAALRYRHSYCQGISPSLRRRSKFDFYWPEFANLGEQPVYKSQLYFNGNYVPGSEDDSVFGFQEYAAEYREFNNEVHGHMRPDVNQSIAMYNFCDSYSQAPVLNSDFMKETPKNLDRSLAVRSSVASQCIADFYFKGKIVREMPAFSIPSKLGGF